MLKFLMVLCAAIGTFVASAPSEARNHNGGYYGGQRGVSVSYGGRYYGDSGYRYNRGHNRRPSYDYSRYNRQNSYRNGGYYQPYYRDNYRSRYNQRNYYRNNRGYNRGHRGRY